MVRVRRGQIGLAVEYGKPVLLQEGLHVYNHPLFAFQGFKKVDEPHINHMSYHVLRVPRGEFAKIEEQARPKLLPEGTHAVDNAVFSYSGFVKSMEAYIKHGTIHIIQVPKGSLGLLFESNYPRILHAGVHIYDSPTLNFVKVVKKTAPQMTHGTITRFRVKRGEIALAWHDNEPVFIEDAGTYHVDSPNFELVTLASALDKEIILGARKIITVYSGEVGVTYKAGTLQVLREGRHVIEDANHRFECFLDTKQVSLRLESVESGKGDLLVCETKDYVSVGIRADVFYRIQDPEKAILQIGTTEKIQQIVQETSVATLNNIVRSTNLNDIAQADTTKAQASPDQENVQAAQALGEHDKPSAPLFYDKAHDLFLQKLHEHFLHDYGIEIANIRIEQFTLMDESMKKSIEGQAAKSAQTMSDLANLQGEAQIKKQVQERDAHIQLQKAQAEAKQRQIEADAEMSQAEAKQRAQQIRSKTEADVKTIAAQATADAKRTEAQAEADAIKIKGLAQAEAAKANAEAIKATAQAEAERAKALSATPLGEKLCLLEIYAEAIKKSNEGVSKVVYVDPSTTSNGNPLGLLTLQSLQADLAHFSASSKQ
jgi:regulator of protease activity HflC (stomatin/prohibitin superfamily)